MHDYYPTMLSSLVSGWREGSWRRSWSSQPPGSKQEIYGGLVAHELSLGRQVKPELKRVWENRGIKEEGSYWGPQAASGRAGAVEGRRLWLACRTLAGESLPSSAQLHPGSTLHLMAFIALTGSSLGIFVYVFVRIRYPGKGNVKSCLCRNKTIIGRVC